MRRRMNRLVGRPPRCRCRQRWPGMACCRRRDCGGDFRSALIANDGEIRRRMRGPITTPFLKSYLKPKFHRCVHGPQAAEWLL